jgi:BirA family biotin operon repressor/biotin-[acetyl-CoA-carboxylase] ligase
LPAAYRPLAADAISAEAARAGAPIDAVWVLEAVDSTNRYLLEQAPTGTVACLCERQTGGRGRRGRQWWADPYCNVLLSLSFRLPAASPALGNLSLVTGVGVRRALMALGVQGITLKWPNDVLWAGRKLGGILIEIRGEAEALRAVVGVGVNCHLTAATADQIGQPWAALDDIAADWDRNRIAGVLIAHLCAVVDQFAAGALDPLRAEWRQAHAFAGHPATLQGGDGRVRHGTIIDVDDEGALVMMIDGEHRTLRSGEVSIRPL